MTGRRVGSRRRRVAGADPWVHLIPDDGAPHAPTTECGCDPQLRTVRDVDGVRRPAFVHSPTWATPSDPTWESH